LLPPLQRQCWGELLEHCNSWRRCDGLPLPLLVLQEQRQRGCLTDVPKQQQLLKEAQQRRLHLLLLLPLALLVGQQRLQRLQLRSQLMHAGGQGLHRLSTNSCLALVRNVRVCCRSLPRHRASQRQRRRHCSLLRLWRCHNGDGCSAAFLLLWLLTMHLDLLLLLLHVLQSSSSFRLELSKCSCKRGQAARPGAGGHNVLRTLCQLGLNAAQQLPLQCLQCSKRRQVGNKVCAGEAAKAGGAKARNGPGASPNACSCLTSSRQPRWCARWRAAAPLSSLCPASVAPRAARAPRASASWAASAASARRYAASTCAISGTAGASSAGKPGRVWCEQHALASRRQPRTCRRSAAGAALTLAAASEGLGAERLKRRQRAPCSGMSMLQDDHMLQALAPCRHFKQWDSLRRAGFDQPSQAAESGWRGRGRADGVWPQSAQPSSVHEQAAQ
jgi:hypothetical protein